MSNERTARQAIKIWMAEHDYTQRLLARRLGISDPHLSNVLNGHATPTPELVKRIARVTGVSLADYARVA